jgi:polyisoprenoid-binding protein YceI
VWTLNATDGELLIRTNVTGRAAKMGHRLTIVMRSWQATATWSGDGAPSAAKLAIDVDSLEILRGEGGLKALSRPEKTLVRSNALRMLGATRFPRISFLADTIEKTRHGYRLTGPLQIHGKTREQVIKLHADDFGAGRRLSTEATVRQSDFGIKQYSLLMGSLKVADEVTVSFTAQRT